MRSKSVLFLFVLLIFALAAMTQTGTRRQKPEAAPALPVATDQQDAEALRADIARMKVLLNQMRTNLAFVQSTESPLKHEFDLNNDMWQVLLSDMERRLERMDHASKPGD